MARPTATDNPDPSHQADLDEAEEEDRLDPEVRERRAAALGQVVRFGDPILRSAASVVSDFDQHLAAEAERMVAIMQGALGVGLAATQVGLMRRVLVFQAGHDSRPTTLVNPQIEWTSDERESLEEGCLSLPGVTVDVERPVLAVVAGCDLDGDRLTIEAAGLEARVLQHEIDHLDGVLILDRTAKEQRRGAIRALREGTSFTPESLDQPDEPEAEG